MIELLLGAMVVAGWLMAVPKAMADARTVRKAADAGAWDFLDRRADRVEARRQRRADAYRKLLARRGRPNADAQPGLRAYAADHYRAFWARRMQVAQAKRDARPTYVYDPNRSAKARAARAKAATTRWMDRADAAIVARAKKVAGSRPVRSVVEPVGKPRSADPQWRPRTAGDPPSIGDVAPQVDPWVHSEPIRDPEETVRLARRDRSEPTRRRPEGTSAAAPAGGSRPTPPIRERCGFCSAPMGESGVCVKNCCGVTPGTFEAAAVRSAGHDVRCGCPSCQWVKTRGPGDAPAASEVTLPPGQEPTGPAPKSGRPSPLDMQFDGNPTLNARDPDAYARYAADLDRDRAGWWECDESEMDGELADEARKRRERGGDAGSGNGDDPAGGPAGTDTTGSDQASSDDNGGTTMTQATATGEAVNYETHKAELAAARQQWQAQIDQADAAARAAAEAKAALDGLQQTARATAGAAQAKADNLAARGLDGETLGHAGTQAEVMDPNKLDAMYEQLEAAEQEAAEARAAAEAGLASVDAEEAAIDAKYADAHATVAGELGGDSSYLASTGAAPAPAA